METERDENGARWGARMATMRGGRKYEVQIVISPGTNVVWEAPDMDIRAYNFAEATAGETTNFGWR